MTKEEYFEKAVDAFGDGKLDESIALYRQALEVDPRYQDALHGLGMALLNHGRLDEAAETARRLIEIDSDDVLAHTSLSMIYHAQGRIEEAEKEGNAAKILGWKEELKKGKSS
jgi:Flp pilus assembly protein TadD